MKQQQTYQAPQVAETHPAEEKARALISQVFEQTEVGRELLKLLHELYVDRQAYPTHPNMIAQFGSNETYAGFVCGQANIIKFFEYVLQLNKQEAEAKARPGILTPDTRVITR